MLSGGSVASWSVTFAARTVTVHDSFVAKSAVGSSEKVVGPPETPAACEPLVAQEIVNDAAVAFTGSVNVTLRFESTGTSVAPLVGVVD